MSFVRQRASRWQRLSAPPHAGWQAEEQREGCPASTSVGCCRRPGPLRGRRRACSQCVCRGRRLLRPSTRLAPPYLARLPLAHRCRRGALSRGRARRAQRSLAQRRRHCEEPAATVVFGGRGAKQWESRARRQRLWLLLLASSALAALALGLLLGRGESAACLLCPPPLLFLRARRGGGFDGGLHAHTTVGSQQHRRRAMLGPAALPICCVCLLSIECPWQSTAPLGTSRAGRPLRQPPRHRALGDAGALCAVGHNTSRPAAACSARLFLRAARCARHRAGRVVVVGLSAPSATVGRSSEAAPPPALAPRALRASCVPAVSLQLPI